MERKRFTDDIYAPERAFKPEFHGRLINGVSLKFDGSVTAVGGGGVSGLTLDAPAHLIGTVDISESADVLIRVHMIDLWHLDAMIHGKYPTKIASTPGAGATAPHMISAFLPFGGGWLPEDTVLLDAARTRAFITGRYGRFTDYAAANVAAITGTLRAAASIPEAVPEKWLRPSWFQKSISLATSSLQLQDSITFGRDSLLVGFLLRQYDDGATGDAQRPDGLLRRLQLDVQGEGQIANYTWGELREETAKFSGIPTLEQKTGIAFLPLYDSREVVAGLPYRFMPANSSVIFTADTLSPVESEFAAITPAVGDALIVTAIAYEVPFSQEVGAA